MLRRFALLAIVALACVAVAACGDDDSSSPSPSSSPTAGVPTISVAPGYTFSITPSAVPGTPTPVPSTTPWQISGQISGTPDMSVFSCSPTPGYYQVLLRGQLNGALLSIFVYTPNAGTLDYANATSALTVSAQLGSPNDAVNDLWFEAAGNREVQGTVIMGTDGSGSMSGILVPPSPSTPGGATTNVTLSGEWKCPPFDFS